MAAFRIVNPRHWLGNRYWADLYHGAELVGRVEKNLNSGGRRAGDYVAWYRTLRVAEARTLADLRADLRDHDDAELAEHDPED